MPTKKPLSPTVEGMSDGENIFVVADGIGLPNVVDPEPHRPRLGFHLSLAGKCSTTMGCSLST
jgi:hypothetical protein